MQRTSSINRMLAIFILLALSASVSVEAQTRVGVRGGMNFASLTFQENDGHWEYVEMSTYASPIAGIILEAGIADAWFVRLEPSYVQKGTAWTIPAFGIDAKQSLKVEVLQVPLALGAQLIDGNHRFTLFAGPNVGFILTDGYSATDVALDFGFGVGMNLSSKTELLVDVRYSRGFTNINAGDPGASRLYTRGLQPMVGVLFTP